MNFGLTEDQTSVLSGLEQLLAGQNTDAPITPVVASYSTEIDSVLVESGFLDIAREEGFGPLEAAMIVERLARLPHVVEAAATAIVAPALSIPAGTHPIALVSGNASKAARFLPMAKVLVVDRGDDAVVINVDPANVEPVDSLLAYPYGRLKNTKGLEQQVIKDVTSLRRRWRIAMAAEAAGCMAAGIALIVDHVTNRRAFGRPLGAFQAIQHRLAMAAETAESTKWLAFRAAWSDTEADAATAAGFAQSRIAQITYDLHQFAGAMGLTLEFPLHLWTYRLRALAGELGGASVQSRAAAAAVWGSMSQSIDEFRKQARTWLEANVPKDLCPPDGKPFREYVLNWQRTQAKGGWAGIAWPKEVGGRGFSVMEQIVWFEEYARAGAPSPLNALFTALNHAGPTLIAVGTPEQKAYHLPKILNGEVIWCQGFSEPGAGSDLFGGLKNRGRVEGDEIVIDGQKIWSSFADIAEWQELLIRTNPDPKAKTSAAFSWVICPMDAPGITVRPIRTMAGATKYCQVFYDSVRIPLSNVVGGLNNGRATANATLSFERGTAALALLIGYTLRVEKLLAACPLDRPELRMRLARLRAEGQGIRAMTYKFALDSEHSVPDASGSIMRLAFAEFSQRVNAAGIDLYGIDAPETVGMHGWAHDYLDTFSETIAGGTAEIQRDIIGERVLGLPRGAR